MKIRTAAHIALCKLSSHLSDKVWCLTKMQYKHIMSCLLERLRVRLNEPYIESVSEGQYAQCVARRPIHRHVAHDGRYGNDADVTVVREGHEEGEGIVHPRVAVDDHFAFVTRGGWGGSTVSAGLCNVQT